jgi:hypothetical protein
LEDEERQYCRALIGILEDLLNLNVKKSMTQGFPLLHTWYYKLPQALDEFLKLAVVANLSGEELSFFVWWANTNTDTGGELSSIARTG